MKKIIYLGVFFLCIIGCTKKAEVHNIDPKTAKEMMNDAIIIDVRTKTEYEEEHIKSAINIPLESIKIGNKKLPNKEKIILVYCKSGNRSKQASQILVNMGYQHVYNFGGIDDWPYETITTAPVSASKKTAFEISVKGIIKSIEMNYVNSLPESVEKTYTFPSDELNITKEQLVGGSITITKEGTIHGAVYNKDFCATKQQDSEKIEITNYVDGKCKDES